MLARLHGNPSKLALPDDEPEGVGVLWAPPPWMDDEQRAQWNYAVEHAPLGLLTETDREVLIVWVSASVEHARAVQEVRKMGQVVKTRDGNAIQNPFLPIMNKQAIIMMNAGDRMGFSPSSRAALGRAGMEMSSARGQIAGSRLSTYLDSKPDRLDN